jgi:hypothetical protein
VQTGLNINDAPMAETETVSDSTSGGLGRALGIGGAALITTVFWTFVVSLAYQWTGHPLSSDTLQTIAIAIATLSVLAMAAIPGSD